MQSNFECLCYYSRFVCNYARENFKDKILEFEKFSEKFEILGNEIWSLTKSWKEIKNQIIKLLARNWS